MKLNLVSPNQSFFTNKIVSSICVVSTQGCLQILEGHAALLTTLAKGVFKFYDTEKNKFCSYIIDSGYLEVSPNGDVFVLAEKVLD